MCYPLLENGPKSHQMRLHAGEEHRAARLILAQMRAVRHPQPGTALGISVDGLIRAMPS